MTEAKPSPAAMIPLPYATLDADGLPDSIPEVETAIDRGESLRRIRKRFPKPLRKPLKIEKYIAKSFRRRFNLDATSGECLCCRETTDEVVRINWFYETRRNFRIAGEGEKPLVQTWHSMCDSCFVAWYERARWSRRLLALAGYLSIAFVGLLIVEYALGFSRSPIGYWIARVRWSCIGASFICSLLGTLLWRLEVPRPLKRSVPRWMRCSSFDSFESRADLIDSAVEHT